MYVIKKLLLLIFRVIFSLEPWQFCLGRSTTQTTKTAFEKITKRSESNEHARYANHGRV